VQRELAEIVAAPTRISLYGDGEGSGYPEECRLCYNLPVLQGDISEELTMTKSVLHPHSLSTSAALAAHRTHHRHAIHCPAMNAFSGGSTSRGFHAVTFVKRLICRNARDKRRQIVFKMGQAGNGEKP
jgi:hypothetical protein